MKQQTTVARGATAGFLAALALAVWFLAIDTIKGQPFSTPGFLASVLFGTNVKVAGLLAVALYTVVHFGAFIVIGVVVAKALKRVEVLPTVLVGLLLGLLLFDIVFYVGVVMTGVNVVKVLGWPQV